MSKYFIIDLAMPLSISWSRYVFFGGKKKFFPREFEIKCRAVIVSNQLNIKRTNHEGEWTRCQTNKSLPNKGDMGLQYMLKNHFQTTTQWFFRYCLDLDWLKSVKVAWRLDSLAATTVNQRTNVKSNTLIQVSLCACMCVYGSNKLR